MKTSLKTAIVALALAVSVSASAEGYQFNKNLTVGSRGADVSALQAALGVTPATGYFGSITKAAVKAYQTSKGISPVSGYFGPLTRASMNMSAPVVPGTPTTPVVLNGQEGFAEYRLAPSPVNDTNIQRSSDVAVYGVEVKAKNADISVERITVDVSSYNTTSLGYENPSTLINSISIKDGSTVLATIPVNSSTFAKYTASSTYYVQISGLSTKVAKDTIKTFTVYFNTNGIDSSRNVGVTVAANGVRVVDGRGISTYNGQALEARNHVFKKAGASTINVKGDATTIYATNYRINNSSNGAEKALTSTFAIKSESGPSKITGVSVVTTASGTTPTNLYLYQGSTLLDSRTVTGGATTTFNIENSNVNIAQDTTTTFTIKADMPATTIAGSAVKTTVTSVAFEKADGSSSTSGASVAGPFHFFATVVPMFTKNSTTLTATNSGTVATTSVVTADFNLSITPAGGDILVASTTAVVSLKNSSGTIVASTTVTGLTDNGLTTYTEGAARTIRFPGVFAMSSFGTGVIPTGSYTAVIESVRYATSTGATWFNLTAGFEPLETGPATIIR